MYLNNCSYHFYQLKRQRAQQAAKRVKLFQAVDQAHFAKETVSSVLKKAPPGEGLDKLQSGAQSRTPPRTPTKEGLRTPERVHYRDYLSPRSQRRREHEQQVSWYMLLNIKDSRWSWFFECVSGLV